MNYSQSQPGLKARAATAALAVTTAFTVISLGLAAVTSEPARASDTPSDVRAALKARLPKTPIDALTCEGFGGLCEVVSGNTLFYVDAAARYLLVGRLYDMETRRDVTAARLLELNPDLIAAGAARAGGDSKPQDEQPAGALPAKVDLSRLPADGAVRWGNPQGPKVVVFSDFQCGYCQRLTGELTTAGVQVEERPISIFGAKSRALSEAVLCAPDPVAALHAAYAGQSARTPQGCKPKGLDANETFARANGFSGTPVMVRASDGAVLQGYRPANEIRRFLGLAPAKGGR
ncbi:thiol:disulfide interchange protein DsbC [Novosphingobium hassiacum]|uniref:Thiol:disulfide interchange protein n=1 Tax=Novosphingobium hassiacum TaxID=173676 RepID=A0A7W6EY22_9SPHN|nr:DsbC family protein [Novosphingobium hassiacum]MBB3862861.1 thiol:disulfide interchange protein DsbC [Novosphingobium hassiacum]